MEEMRRTDEMRREEENGTVTFPNSQLSPYH